MKFISKNLLTFLTLTSLFVYSIPVHAATGRKVMVATAHPFASATALHVLKEGGNAADAAIAAQWVLNVAEPQSSGIGGGGFFLYFEASSGRIYALDGREMAPADATPDMFLDAAGNPLPFYPSRITGGLPVGVPGTLKLLKRAHERFGSGVFTFAALFEPAIELADKGFRISPRLAYFINKEKDRLQLFEDARRIFFTKEGIPLPENSPLIQKDLANTFRLIQQKGVLPFYEGEIADDIVNAVQRAPYHPGRMKKEDLAFYNVRERDPIYSTYRNFQIFGMGPPSSGGTTVMETLNIMESFDIPSMGKDVEFSHVFLESQKLAFQDRNLYLGDSDFVEIPVDKLISKSYARERAQKIDRDQTLEIYYQNLPEEGDQTSHISIVDQDGNMVSFTTTIEHVFGSAMIVPGRGFFLNNELTDFDAVPERDGALKANAPGPNKRPRSSMSPTFVFHEGKPFLIVGSPGGSTIIGTVLNILVQMIDFESSIIDAMHAPKMINRDGPSELERGLFDNPGLKKELQNRKHKLKQIDSFGNAQAVFFDHDNDQIIGVSDPRGEGSAMGY